MRTRETIKLVDIDDVPLQSDVLSDRYRERLLADDVFPPVKLSRNHDGVLHVCDGRHRICAMRKIGRTTVFAVIDFCRG